MRNKAIGRALRSVRTLFEVGTSAGLSDGQLLDRYLLREPDVAEPAFRALVERHGPMVLLACRGVLHDAHASEDAFQATFLILARKAGSIRNRDSVKSWLFGVARRVAARAKAGRNRLAAHEQPGGAMAGAEALEADQPGDPVPEIREEVDRLPERYRAPIVLCYWNGLTHEQAASQLRVPASTVRVRLMRGRSRLRERLIRRGLAPTVLALLSTRRATAAIPDSLVDETTKAAIQIALGRAAGVRASVAVLVQGVIRSMFFAKIKLVAAALSVLVLGATLALSSIAGPTPVAQDAAARKNAKTATAPGATEVQKPAGEGPEVPGLTLSRKHWARTTLQRGTVVAHQSADLYAKVSGFLTKLPVDIGSRVKKGALLVELDDPELLVAVERARAEVQRAEAHVKKASAALEVAQAAVSREHARFQAASSAVSESESRMRGKKKTLDRIRDLAKQGQVEQRVADEEAAQYGSAEAAVNSARSDVLVAKATEIEAQAKIHEANADRAEAESELRIARAGLDTAEIIASYTKILAPFDGIVTRRNGNVGELVRSPTAGNTKPILTIVQPDSVRVIFEVPHNEAPELDEGDQATVRFDALGPRQTFRGVVARTAYAIDPRTNTLRAEIDLPNTDGRIRPGLIGDVTVELTSRENVLSIPSTAVGLITGDVTGVCWRVVAGRAVRTEFKIGEENDGAIEILEGLKEGDVVIMNAGLPTADGQAVRVTPAKEETLGPQ